MSNAAAAFLCGVVSGGSQLVATLLMARHLGPTLWGTLCYLLSVIDIFRVVVNAGTDLVAVRLMAIDRVSSRRLLFHLVLVKTVLGLGCILALLAATELVPDLRAYRSELMVLGLGLFAFAYMNSATVRFRTEHLMSRLLPAKLVYGVALIVSVILATRRDAGVDTFIGVLLGGEVLHWLCVQLTARLTWNDAASRLYRPQRDWFKRILVDGVPAGLIAILVVLYSRLGVFLLRELHGAEQVGLYYLIVRICEPGLAAAGAFGDSVLPVLSRLVHAQDYVEVRRRMVLYAWRVLGVSILAAALVSVAPSSWIAVGVGSDVASSGALAIMAWATVCMSQSIVHSAALYAFGKYRVVLWLALWNLGVYAVFALSMIPRWRVVGATAATLVTELASAIVVILLAHRVARRSGLTAA